MRVRRFLLGMIVVLCSAQLSSLFAQNNASPPILGAAPEFHNGIWLNTDVPLKLQNLRGKVVLLEMWTFGCINCIRTLPYMIEWHETYAAAGLVVVGNHYPEFSFEADLDNLRAAAARLGVTYPVLQDNQRQTWSAYTNRYWPTIYLIDKQGRLRYRHFGEGAYTLTENTIQQLLAESYVPDETADEILLVWSLTANEELNVRSGAGTQFDRIGRILPGEAYYVQEQVGDWYRILFNDQPAYVSARYVTVTKAEAGN